MPIPSLGNFHIFYLFPFVTALAVSQARRSGQARGGGGERGAIGSRRRRTPRDLREECCAQSRTKSGLAK